MSDAIQRQEPAGDYLLIIRVRDDYLDESDADESPYLILSGYDTWRAALMERSFIMAAARGYLDVVNRLTAPPPHAIWTTADGSTVYLPAVESITIWRNRGRARFVDAAPWDDTDG